MKVYGALEVAQLEWFTNAGKPAAANYPYRVIWISDLKQAQVSDGSQWVVIGGGGGGGSLQWVESALSPLPAVNNNIRTYEFNNADTQYLYALIKVPSAYAVGNPITMKTSFYSAGNANTVLMQTLTTLIRVGTDAVTSTTNQRTSTNAAVTLTVGTVNIPQAVTFDLSSTIGQVNAVSISANDLLLVRLTRGTDTSTSASLVPVYGAEVLFS